MGQKWTAVACRRNKALGLDELTSWVKREQRRWSRTGLFGASTFRGWAGKVEPAKETEAAARRVG